MEDSLKHSIQGNHNLFCKVFWVTGNFSIIFAVLKIIMPLISVLERLPGYFMNDFFFTLLGKKSSCIQIAINAGYSMESDCLLLLMCFNYFMFLIHLSLLQRVRHQEGGNISGKFLASWIRGVWGIKRAVNRNTRHSDLDIPVCKLSMLVNGWPWQCLTLSVIKLFKLKKYCSKEVFLWLSSKTTCKGPICEMNDNIHFYISF